MIKQLTLKKENSDFVFYLEKINFINKINIFCTLHPSKRPKSINQPEGQWERRTKKDKLETLDTRSPCLVLHTFVLMVPMSR